MGDHGKVIQSSGRDQWNAIDPNLDTADDGPLILVFGSFWDGLKQVSSRPIVRHRGTDHGAAEPSRAASVSQGTQPGSAARQSCDAGGNAIEAPFVFKHGGTYYLFASIDYCCRGAKRDTR